MFIVFVYMLMFTYLSYAFLYIYIYIYTYIYMYIYIEREREIVISALAHAKKLGSSSCYHAAFLSGDVISVSYYSLLLLPMYHYLSVFNIVCIIIYHYLWASIGCRATAAADWVRGGGLKNPLGCKIHVCVYIYIYRYI